MNDAHAPTSELREHAVPAEHHLPGRKRTRGTRERIPRIPRADTQGLRTGVPTPTNSVERGGKGGMARPLLYADVMLVRERMTSPAVTQGPDTTVTALIAVLRLRGISAVPIVENGVLLGIVSTTDLLSAPSRARAKDVMSLPVLTALPDDQLDTAARRLAAGRIHRLVVVDDARVAGILSARDILSEVRRRKQTDPVRDIMRAPVESIEVGLPVVDAVERLAHANVHGIVVVDGASPVGVFTHTEALAARKLPPALQGAPVEDVMSYETICLDVATPIHRAASYMVSMNVRRILVVEHRRLVGIVSCLDLVDVLARARAREPEMLS
jgi:predicted transcriptional regulator